MSRQSQKIQKVFKDTLTNGITLDEAIPVREVIEECEKNNKLFSYKDMFIAPIKTTLDGLESIRIIFTVKEESGKVQNIERIMTLVKELEEILVHLDYCRLDKNDNFIYLDIIKKLKEVE